VRRFLKVSLILLALLGGLIAVGAYFLRVKEHRNVVYSRINGQNLQVDIYEPANRFSDPRPAVLLIHGGAWATGSKDEFREPARNLARLGYVAIAVQYRLVTETTNPWPAQLDDCQRAVRWVRAHAKDYHVDPNRIGALGGSAGGHLAACLGTMETRDNSDPELARYSSKVTCVVNLCGPSDLSDDLAPKVAEGAWTNERIRILLGHSAKERPDIARAASPLYCVNAQSAPTLICHGRQDPIVPLDQSEWFVEALQKTGVEAKLLVHNGGHGFNDSEAILQFLKETRTFLDRHLSGENGQR